MGHTKGPWMRHEECPREVYSAHTINPGGGDFHLPICRCGTDKLLGVPREDAIANARLISATPELLDACKEIVDYYQKMSGNENCPVADKYWIKGAIMARAAIAKAEGRSQ